MTNEQFKQEAIKKAYGEYFKSHKINENGWHAANDPNTDKPEQNGFKLQDVYILSNLMWRPKSLAGIETNNGWIRIEEDGSNLPETRGKEDVWLFGDDGEIHIANTVLLNDWEIKYYWIKNATHYQPIIKPQPPIY